MTLSEYIKNLQDLLERHPEAAEYAVVYASDEEGNSYDEVWHTPTIGYFEFDPCMHDSWWAPEEQQEGPNNSVCIN